MRMRTDTSTDDTACDTDTRLMCESGCGVRVRTRTPSPSARSLHASSQRRKVGERREPRLEGREVEVHLVEGGAVAGGREDVEQRIVVVA